jgi:hypothetical protein
MLGLSEESGNKALSELKERFLTNNIGKTL